MKIHGHILLILFIWLFLLFIISCESLGRADKNEYLEYESINLEFSLEYPQVWKIFESSEAILLSNDINNFIKSEDERLLEAYDFLSKITVVENQDLVEFIRTISVLKNSSKEYTIADMKDLLSNIPGEEQATIFSLYQELFLRAPSYQIKFLSLDDGLIIGDLKESEAQLKTIYILKLFSQENNLVVFEEVVFNSKLLQDGDLTPFVFVAESVKINYNDEE